MKAIILGSIQLLLITGISSAVRGQSPGHFDSLPQQLGQFSSPVERWLGDSETRHGRAYWMPGSEAWVFVYRCSVEGSNPRAGDSAQSSPTAEVEVHLNSLKESLRAGRILRLEPAYRSPIPPETAPVLGEALAVAVERPDGVFLDFFYSVVVGEHCFNVHSAVARSRLAGVEVPLVIRELAHYVRGTRAPRGTAGSPLRGKPP
jgi:hypothetical protein